MKKSELKALIMECIDEMYSTNTSHWNYQKDVDSHIDDKTAKQIANDIYGDEINKIYPPEIDKNGNKTYKVELNTSQYMMTIIKDYRGTWSYTTDGGIRSKQIVYDKPLNEAQISTHLNDKPFQVAVTNDPKLPLRKWDHKGTCYAKSAKSAAFKYGDGEFIGVQNGYYKFEKNFVFVK